MNTQDWFPLELIGLISLQSKGLLTVFSSTVFESLNSLHSAFSMVQLSNPYTASGEKNKQTNKKNQKNPT